MPLVGKNLPFVRHPLAGGPQSPMLESA